MLVKPPAIYLKQMDRANYLYFSYRSLGKEIHLSISLYYLGRVKKHCLKLNINTIALAISNFSAAFGKGEKWSFSSTE